MRQEFVTKNSCKFCNKNIYSIKISWRVFDKIGTDWNISKITQHANKLTMAKHSLQLEKAILQDLLTDQKTLIKTKELECRDLINNLIQSRWYTGRSITEVAILQTAVAIDSTRWEMEKELEEMEQNVHMSTLAIYIRLMTDTQELFTSDDSSIFKELEEMEQDVHMSTLARYIGLMADTQELFTPDGSSIFKKLEEIDISD